MVQFITEVRPRLGKFGVYYHLYVSGIHNYKNLKG